MIEVLPNWHPVFVHFTVALLLVAVVFALVSVPLPAGTLRSEWAVFARWSLWLGTGFAAVTAVFGWLAFNSVTHEDQSHAAMLVHRNWALVTVAVFLVLMGWSLWRRHRDKETSVAFLTGLVVGGGLLVVTAWHGGELVYRHGLGVLSLPRAEQAGGDHSHGPSGDHDHDPKPREPAKDGAQAPAKTTTHNHADHAH